MAYILSLPDTWEICVEHLYGNASDHDGRTSVTGAMHELRDFGYLHLDRLIGEKGQMAGSRWLAFDDPSENQFLKLAESSVSRLSDSPNVGKPTTIKETENKGHTETKETEQMNKGRLLADQSCFSDKPQCKPAKSPAPHPTWQEVESHAKREGINLSAALRFFKLNEFHGWRTKTGPIRKWKCALIAYVHAEPANAQKRDKMTNDEFWNWARAEFDEDELGHAGPWVTACIKNGWMKTNAITGQTEPIGDFKAACRAWVDECMAMNIYR